MNVKPLADRVIIRPLEPEEKTAGGIIIPDAAKENLKRRSRCSRSRQNRR